MGDPGLEKVVLEQIPHLSMCLAFGCWFIAAAAVTCAGFVHVRVSVCEERAQL
jgi:hypothetical protein